MCLVANALLAGCSAREVIEPVEEIRREAVAHPRAPLPLRVLVAPLEMAAEMAAELGRGTATATAATAEAALATSAVPEFRVEAFRDEIVEALAAARACASVAGVEPPPRDRPRASHEALLADAYAKGDDLLLEPRLRRYELSYRGPPSEGHHFLTCFTWFTVYFPAWTLEDELYACDLELEVTLTAVGSQKRLRRTVYRGPEEPVLLREFDRGISLTGPFRVASSLDADHWREVAKHVANPARRAVLGRLAEDLRALPPDEPGLASRLLVSIGAGHFDPKKVEHPLLQAEDDARAFRDLVVDGGVVPTKNAVVLTSAGASRLESLRAIRAAAARARPADTLYLFFAGYGASAAGVPLLVTADFDPARPLETGLPLAELAKVLDAAPCRQVLVLDASFAGGGERVRTLALRGGDADPGSLGERFRALARPRRAIVLSAGAAGEAHETDRFASNFMGFLLENLASPAAPVERDQTVTLNALFDKVRSDTRNPFYPPQEPLWIGDPASFPIPLVTRHAR